MKKISIPREVKMWLGGSLVGMVYGVMWFSELSKSPAVLLAVLSFGAILTGSGRKITKDESKKGKENIILLLGLIVLLAFVLVRMLNK